MKKIFLFTAASVLAIAGCTSTPDYDEQEALYPTLTKEQINQNVQEIFGTTFDNHDWTMTSTGTVSITADANFSNIVSVQILTESPFLNKNAMVLNQANATNGETVELSYEAPNGSTRLIAACVNNLGEYYIKGFDINEKHVNFSSHSAAKTRGETYLLPDISTIKLEFVNAAYSYNARRTQAIATGNNNASISAWKNKNWEEERVWRATNTNSESNGWQIINNSILRTIDPISTEEKKALEDILESYLGGEANLRKRYNNIDAIRNTNIFQTNNNYLTSDGNPLIVTPVLTSSTELGHLYYYYYNPEELTGKSDAEQLKYIKSLPKFKAIQGSYTRDEAKKKGYIDNQNKGFFKLHQFLLPYYGENQQFIGDVNKKNITDFCTTDGQVVRIRNGRPGYDGNEYYMVYTGNNDIKLATKYEDDDDNIAYQLWQVFTTIDGGYKLLYNIGAQQFLVRHFNAGNDWTSNYSIDYETVMKSRFVFDDNNHIWRFDNIGVGLGTDLSQKANNFKIATDKKADYGNGENAKWYFEPYINNDLATNNVKLSLVVEVQAQSLSIPAGYKIGFMHRKEGNNLSNDFETSTRGETYGDGRLNTEINTFPNYSTAINDYGMRLNDPRFAFFKANGRKYMTLEDGSDCNFTDFTLEINSGVIEDPDPLKVNVGVYTFCFEDRQDGDYDMNDVIIKAVRIDKTHVLFSVEACGAFDELYIHNINGKVLNKNTEVHKMFNVDLGTFVNTQGGNPRAPIQEIVTVKENYSFNNTSSDQIYIYNKTTDKEIRLSTAGQDPHAIMIPCDYEYPLEKNCIKDVNEEFVKWGEGDSSCSNWYNYSVKDKVYQTTGFTILSSTILAYPQFFGENKK